MSRPKSSRWLLAVAFAAVAVAGPAASAPGQPSGVGGGYWIVLASDRDGQTRAYSMRPDGSRLTPLFADGSAQYPAAISADGSTIAYDDLYAGGTGVSVSRADGTRLHRLGLDAAGRVGISRDGKRVALERLGGIWIVGSDGRGLRRVTTGDDGGPNWSPDGKALSLIRSHDERSALVVQPLGGRGRVLVRGPITTTGPGEARWSPDGRWIAYQDNVSLWLVRPDGTGRRRVAGGKISAFGWSPDGKWLAYGFGYPQDVAVVGVAGQGWRRLGIRAVSSIFALSWSPDGRLLALQSEPLRSAAEGVWVVGVDGRGLRRVTRGGKNELVGWTPLAPARPPAAPLLPSERILDARTVATRRPVAALSADGSRVAVVVGRTAADCDHVVVWTPASRTLDRFRPPAPCREGGHDSGPSLYDVELAGSRAAWASYFGCGNSCEFTVTTATLAQRSPVDLASTSSNSSDANVDFHLGGAGDLLVFNDDSRLVRIGGGREQCEKGAGAVASICATLRVGAHACCVDSVVGGLIAIREAEAVAVLDAQGKLVRVFPFGPEEVSAARLDGNGLVVARAGVLELYDIATGAGLLQRPLPAGYRLSDVDGGIAVLRSDDNDTITLLRLQDGSSLTLMPGRRPRLADLEPDGLYYSYATADGGGRVVFLPRAEVLRKLGGGS